MGEHSFLVVQESEGFTAGIFSLRLRAGLSSGPPTSLQQLLLASLRLLVLFQDRSLHLRSLSSLPGTGIEHRGEVGWKELQSFTCIMISKTTDKASDRKTNVKIRN